MKKSLFQKVVLLLFLSALSNLQVQAIHLRGGYITHTADHQNPRKVYFKLILFTDVESTAQEIEVEVYHSDGSSQTVRFSSENLLCYGTRKRIFSWNHTFASNGTYTVHWYGMNRNGGIMNMADPSYLLSQYIKLPAGLLSQSRGTFAFACHCRCRCPA